ncbi:ABC transporter permease [Streptomyces sp. NPDC090442]|uniref:ABC transporter permease n=1 Tax=Streptomyces sp. NPDC090442 TaxID=3365962 RepID=UPI00381A7B57
MFRTALRNVLAHKARLLMTVLAVLLGVAFVSGTLIFTSTISEAYQKNSQKGFNHLDVAIRPSGSAGLGQDLLQAAGKLPGAAAVSGTVSGFTAVVGKDGKPVGDGFTMQGANYAPGADGKDARYPLKDGRAPKSAGEIALDAKTADRAGYKVGDTVRMSVNGPVLRPKLTGIFTTADGNVSAGGSLALFDTATAQKLLAKPGEFSEIVITAAPGTSPTVLKAATEKILPKGPDGQDTAWAVTGAQLADEQAQANARDLDSMKTTLLTFAGISLFVGVFVIANTFTMLIAQRTKELALLRAVGASRRQVTRSVLIEALVVGTVAGVSGLLTGIGIGAAIRLLLTTTSATVPDGPLVISPATVLLSLSVGITVTVLAAWLPARRAAKIPPVAALNSVHATATTRSLTVRNTTGALLAATGIALVLAATRMGTSGKVPMGAGTALLLTGVIVLMPLLLRPLTAAAAPLLHTAGICGRLARSNALRNPRRTAATASALMIGITLITGLTVIALSVQKGIDNKAAASLKADYLVSMANGNALSPDVNKTLAATPRVSATSPLRSASANVDGTDTRLTGVNGKTISELIRLDFTEGSLTRLGDNTKPMAVADTQTAATRGWKTGSVVPVTFEDGKQSTLTISGIFHGNDLFRGILLDNAILAPHQSHTTDQQVMVKVHGGATDAAKDTLHQALANNPVITIADRHAVSNRIATTVNLLLNMVYALLATALAVACLGIVNTLAMSVFERSHEIGVLRAIGLEHKGVKRMIRLEALTISLFGALLGTGLGILLGWAAGELIRQQFTAYEFVLPWGRTAAFLALSAPLGTLAALWPARRAARTDILTAINGA